MSADRPRPSALAGVAARATAGSLAFAVPALPVIAWVTALTSTGGRPAPWTAGVALLAALTLALLATRGGAPARATAAAACLLAVVGLVVLAAQLGHTLRWPEGLDDQDRVRAVVEVTADPVATHGFRREGGSRTAATLVSVSRIGDADHSLPVRAPVLLFDSADAPAHRLGATLALEASLVRTEPGDDVAWLLVSVTDETLIAPPSGPVAVAGDLRAGFVAWAIGLPGDGGALLPGLAIGDTSAVDAGLRDAMVQSSLSHLTAVSGANCALVVAGVVVILGLIGASLPVRLIGGALALAAFVVLVTPQPSVLRAAVMAVAVLVATACGRRRGGVAALGLAVVVLLVHDPWLARNAGFALSAAATAGLLLFSGPLARALGRVMPHPIALAVAIPTAAQVACQPILILLRPDIPLLSVPANLLAAPAAPFATVLGLLACLALPGIPWLGAVLGTAGWAPSAWIAAVARFFASVPASVPWVPGVLGAALAAAAVLLVAVGMLRRRPFLALMGSALVVLTVVPLLATAVGREWSRPAEWDLAACDVGQGAATLLNGGDGTVALVDTGDEPRLLADCLDLLGVDRIALLVLTHFDRDHIGAAPSLLGRVDHLLVGPSDGPEADRLVADLRAGGAEVHRAEGARHGTLGRLSWRALWPPTGLDPGNDASIVLDIRAPGLSALLLGDLGEETQDRLLRLGDIRPVDVVGVAHHGSADQSPRLYEALGADLALVSVGADNTYGHPAASLLDLLESLGDRVERTDRTGTVVVTAARDGVAASVWTERAEVGEGDVGAAR